MKRMVDLRGGQGRISRLGRFDNEGFIHMAAYRLLIIASILYGILLILALYYHATLMSYVKLSTAIVWVLFTPQVYETVKGISLISSRGLAFGHLSKEYKEIMHNKYHKSAGIFKYLPQLALIFWAWGFVVLVLYWQI